MGRKRIKYDRDGDRVEKMANGYYIATTPSGERVRKRSIRNMTDPPLIEFPTVPGNPKATIAGEIVEDSAFTIDFSKKQSRDANGRYIRGRVPGSVRWKQELRKSSQERNKVVSKEKLRLAANDQLWRVSMRDALQKIMSFRVEIFCAYLVLWKKRTVVEVKNEYNIEVTDEVLSVLDKSEPTFIQLSAAEMAIKASRNADFAMKVLEILEGRAANQVQLDKIKRENDSKATRSKENGSKKSSDDEFQRTLDQLSSMIHEDSTVSTPLESQSDWSKKSNEVKKNQQVALYDGTDPLESVKPPEPSIPSEELALQALRASKPKPELPPDATYEQKLNFARANDDHEMVQELLDETLENTATIDLFN